MKRKFSFGLFIVPAVLLIVTCDQFSVVKKDSTDTPQYTTTVYTAGIYSTSTGATDTYPVYWTGTARNSLPGSGYACDIAVDSGTVYTVGYTREGSDIHAALWTNLTRTDLNPSGGSGSYASAVCVSGGTVYSAGSWDNDAKPCYWAGTTRTDLPVPEAGASTFIRGITVYEGVVYTGGYYEGGMGNTPCYWKGSERVELPIGSYTYGYVRSIAVVAGSVYVGGYYSNGTDLIPCYWKDGVKTDLPMPVSGGASGYVSDITVAGDVVYCAGYYGMNAWTYSVPCFWRNGVRVELPASTTGTAAVNSICVFENKVYAAGNYYNGTLETPCFWVDGVRTDLAGDGSHSARAFGIWVVKEKISG